ncbi:hypothetical protein AB0D49_13000 [Streptomyces sp. NPDC048290]|uniref:hypothetical protein n=1 Tax=Streptomyces sp. NPDC048290 TaxID=3155811 RepID=UPI00342E237B
MVHVTRLLEKGRENATETVPGLFLTPPAVRAVQPWRAPVRPGAAPVHGADVVQVESPGGGLDRAAESGPVQGGLHRDLAGEVARLNLDAIEPGLRETLAGLRREVDGTADAGNALRSAVAARIADQQAAPLSAA